MHWQKIQLHICIGKPVQNRRSEVMFCRFLLSSVLGNSNIVDWRHPEQLLEGVTTFLFLHNFSFCLFQKFRQLNIVRSYFVDSRINAIPGENIGRVHVIFQLSAHIHESPIEVSECCPCSHYHFRLLLRVAGVTTIL